MGHNRYPQSRKGQETINCADREKNQTKSADVTGLVTGNVTAHVTHTVAASTAAAKAENATKQSENGCGIASQGQSSCAGPVTADPATKIRTSVGEDDAVHGTPAQPASAHATGRTQPGFSGESEGLAPNMNCSTIRQTETDSVSGGVSGKIKQKLRRRKASLPANLTRDGDAYVFQRRVPQSRRKTTLPKDFTNRNSSNILRIRLGSMPLPEARKRARHLNSLFDIVVASMIAQEHPDPFDVVATALRRVRDSFSESAPPLDRATAIYATHIRDIVLAERARGTGEPGNVIAHHAGAITANAFARMQRFSALMDRLTVDPGLLDHLDPDHPALMNPQPSQVSGGQTQAEFARVPASAGTGAGKTPVGHDQHTDRLGLDSIALAHQMEEEAGTDHVAFAPQRPVAHDAASAETPKATASVARLPADQVAPPHAGSDTLAATMATGHLGRVPDTIATQPDATAQDRMPANQAKPPASDESVVVSTDSAHETIPASALPQQNDPPMGSNAGDHPAQRVIPASVLVASYDSRYAFGGFGLTTAPVSASNWQWPQTGEPHHPPAPSAGPTFSELADSYEERHRQRGATEKLLSKARLARATFVALMGDRPITAYRPRDLQFYIDRMQYWPKNHIKRSPELRGVALKDWPIAQIIEKNHDFKDEGISRKTLEDSYVAFVRAIIRDRRTELGFADPFHDMKIAWPLSSASPRKRLPIAMSTLNKVFASGVEIGFLEEAILPLMAYLTGRRIGLLLHLRGEDFRQREGVWIAHPQSHIRFEGKRIRVPYKTEASLRAFVLHNVLDEIGFSLWASEQKGPIFGNVLRYPDPSKLTSKRLNRLLQRAGAIGENIEVLHSLRHQAIDRMRSAKLDDKSRYLQAGHRGAWTEHDDYGAENLSGENLHAVANMPIDKELDLTPFKGLDFDRMAKAIRTMGRRPG